MRGRPTKYTKALGERICERIANGESLARICRADNVPDKATIHRWLLSDSKIYAEFRDKYAKAREIQYQGLADEILDIADDGSNDWMEKLNQGGEAVGWMINGEYYGRSRLRVDTRKWFLSKVLPKFADGKVDNAPKTDLAAIISELIQELPN